MPKIGDRVIIEGAKVGQQRREGSLIGITGRLLNVRWNDGTTSLLTPGAGSVTFHPGKGNGAARGKASASKKASAKPKSTRTGVKAGKKSAAKKTSAKTTGGSRKAKRR